MFLGPLMRRCRMSRSRNFSLPALNDSHFYATDTIAAVFDSPLKTTVQLCRYFVRTNNLGSYLRHSSSIPAHADKNTQRLLWYASSPASVFGSKVKKKPRQRAEHGLHCISLWLTSNSKICLLQPPGTEITPACSSLTLWRCPEAIPT